MDGKELARFFYGYYHRPEPEKIPAAFAAFLKRDGSGALKKRSYDPLMWLSGFAELYKLNPQLRPGLIRAAAKYPERHKIYVALILTGAGAAETELKDADPELKRLFADIKNQGRPSLLSFTEITRPAQLDALWMRFFVTGKFEPIRRLVYELRKRDGAMPLAEAKKLGRKPTPAEMKKILPALIGGAAEWSLASNAQQHKLVGYYLESMMLRKQYPDLDAAVKIGGMLVKAGLMEVFDKPDGGKGLRAVLKPAAKKPAPRGNVKKNPSGK